MERILVEGCETQRTEITFFVGKIAKAQWTIDSVWRNGDIVLIRCYVSSISGSRRHMQDGWLAHDPKDVKAKREELRHLLLNKNANIKWTASLKRPTTTGDLRL